MTSLAALLWTILPACLTQQSLYSHSTLYRIRPGMIATGYCIAPICMTLDGTVFLTFYLQLSSVLVV